MANAGLQTARDRPQLLFLSQSLPHPPHSGVQSRTFNVLRQLQREFDVTLLSFSRKRHQSDTKARSRARTALAAQLTRVLDPVPIQAENSILRQIADHGRSILTQRPYTHYQYQAEPYRRQLEAVLRDWVPDLIHLDSIDLAGSLKLLPNAPVACTHHDVESELLARKAGQVRNPVLRRYVLHQSRLVQRLERRVTSSFATNLMMSDLDADRLKKVAPSARTLVVPNGVDTSYFAPLQHCKKIPGRILFMGPTYMFANRDGLEFFLSEVWSRVRALCPVATLELVGRNSPEDRSRYESVAGVIPSGYVPDVRPHLARASCSIVPLRIGGGTRIKILESWAMSTAVVSTTIGCEGLDAVDGKNILIRDTPESFAQAVAEILTNPERSEQVGREGCRTVEAAYSWETIGAHLRAAYLNIMRSRRETPVAASG